MRKTPKVKVRNRQLRPFTAPFTPLELRKQIYLPEFTLTLVRTPFLPPRYASFWVPLSFNKLDIKDYLKRLYGVNVVSVRSYVEQQKPTRELGGGKSGYGKWRRPQSRKKMTIEMSEPFVWPEEPKDLTPWEKDVFFGAKEMQEEFQDSRGPDAGKQPNKDERQALADQAQRLLQGKETWKPTWRALGLNYDRSAFGRLHALGAGTGAGKR